MWYSLIMNEAFIFVRKNFPHFILFIFIYGTLFHDSPMQYVKIVCSRKSPIGRGPEAVTVGKADINR